MVNMRHFKIGRIYGGRDKRMGGIKVIDRRGNMMTIEYDSGKTDVLTVFIDRAGNEAASEIGDRCPWMWQYSAAITMRG